MWTTLERMITARRGAFALAFLVLASLAFRLHVSHECSFWLDEAVTHRGVAERWPVVLRGPSHEHPPLMYVLVKLAIGLLGAHETGLRAVSIFFGCALLLAAYELCLELGLTVVRALLVVATLALAPFFIRHGTEARHYALLATFVTLATTRALRGPVRGRDIVGFAASALAAAFTHYFGLAYALALLATVALGIVPARKQLRPIGWVARIGLLLGVLALLGVVAVRALAVGRKFESGPVVAKAGILLNTDLLRDIASEYSFLAFEGWPLAIEAALALVGLVLLSGRLHGAARLLPLGIGVAPCLAAMFLSSTHFVAARYLVPSGIFYHLGACVALFAAIDGLRSLLARGARAQRFAPLVAGLSLTAVFAARLREFPNGFGIGADDYRGLQRYFVSQLAKDTRLVAFYGSFGQLLFGKEYRLGSAPIWLERFRPVRGIDRYLVAEIHVTDAERRADFEALVERQFGLSREAWRSLPLVPLPPSRYQPAVAARLLELPKDRVYRPSKNERQRKP
jgi:uncharacterized membrane protein